MEMNGVAHIHLTVCDFAACRAFYAKLFTWLDMQVIFDSPQVFYGVGSRTGIAISPADERFRGERFEQRRIGLHHFCLRARRREDIDNMHEFLKSIGARSFTRPRKHAGRRDTTQCFSRTRTASDSRPTTSRARAI